MPELIPAAVNIIRVAWGPGWELVFRSDDPVPAEAYPRLSGAVLALDLARAATGES